MAFEAALETFDDMVIAGNGAFSTRWRWECLGMGSNETAEQAGRGYKGQWHTEASSYAAVFVVILWRSLVVLLERSVEGKRRIQGSSWYLKGGAWQGVGKGLGGAVCMGSGVSPPSVSKWEGGVVRLVEAILSLLRDVS